jgi:hypothetical protein
MISGGQTKADSIGVTRDWKGRGTSSIVEALYRLDAVGPIDEKRVSARTLVCALPLRVISAK